VSIGVYNNFLIRRTQVDATRKNEAINAPADLLVCVCANIDCDSDCECNLTVKVSRKLYVHSLSVNRDISYLCVVVKLLHLFDNPHGASC
jgi:hypothetical protein